MRQTWKSWKKQWGVSKWRAYSGEHVCNLSFLMYLDYSSLGILTFWLTVELSICVSFFNIHWIKCLIVDFCWLAARLIPVGYGIKKLQIMMTIVDDLVSVDSLIEEHLTVEPANEYIQSCDIVAFNKICKCGTQFLWHYTTVLTEDTLL